MAIVSASFTGLGVGTQFFIGHNEEFDYSVSGTFSGTVVIEESETSGMAWVEVLRATGAGSGRFRTNHSGGGDARYRFRCIAYGSGTIVTSLADVDDIVFQVRDKRGNSVLGVRESGVDILDSIDSAYTVDPLNRAVINGDMVLGGVTPLSSTAGGAGASAALSGSTFGADRPGVATLQTGTDTTGFASLATVIHEVNGGSIFTSEIKINNLSTVSDEFQVWVGWGNTANASDFTNGYFFRYRRTASTNWQICTLNSTTETAVNTATAVQENAWITLQLKINDNRDVVEYFVNGNRVGVVNTNLPASNAFLYGVAKVVKSAGTTNRTVDVDLVHCNLKVTR
jgi:hypothetical protein